MLFRSYGSPHGGMPKAPTCGMWAAGTHNQHGTRASCSRSPERMKNPRGSAGRSENSFRWRGDSARLARVKICSRVERVGSNGSYIIRLAGCPWKVVLGPPTHITSSSLALHLTLFTTNIQDVHEDSRCYLPRCSQHDRCCSCQ